MKRIAAGIVGLVLAFGTVAACSTDADTVNSNLDKDAEQFKVARKISFVNGITDKEMLRVEGFCSIEYGTQKIDVTCKVIEKGQTKYLRHTLVRSDNVFAVSEQALASDVSADRYKFVVRPQTLIPEVDVRTNADDVD